MSDHIGDEFTGTISSVTNFGLFVQLDDVYVDGLVHISSLQSDYYQYQEAAHRLVGDRTRITYGLGDKLKVKVVRVSLDDRKIDFELADGVVGKPDRSRRGQNQKPPARSKQRSAKPKRKKPASSANKGKPKKKGRKH